MEEAGMPLVSLHIEAPHGDMEAQRRALYRVLEAHPDLVVIQAHFGVQRHGSLDDHARLFERFPNFHRDLSVTPRGVSEWAPRNEWRDFCIRYASRLLYGSDAMSPWKKGDRLWVNGYLDSYTRHFAYFETDGETLFSGPKGDRKNMVRLQGLALPEAALESIYWRNACRLLPHVADAMRALGYSVDDEGKGPAMTPRAERLLRIAKKANAADIASLSPDDRSELGSDLVRLNNLLTVARR
jgi:predicted TIM-barrel fold metal-dependent hydrolase